MTLTASDLALHARLGIPPELLAAAGVRRVTDAEARELLSSRHAGDLAGVAYVYLDPTSGRPGTCRVRRDHPELEDGKPKDKYLSAYGDQRHLFFPPGAGAVLTDTAVPVAVVESEKSALAMTAAARRANRSLLTVGTGGCWGWRGRRGRTTDATGARVEEVGALPDVDRLTWRGRDVVVIFDANAATSSKVQAARRALAAELQRRGAHVRIGEMPADDPAINGPDDLIATRGDRALWNVADQARPVQAATAADVLREAGLEDASNVTLTDLEGRLRLVKAALHGADALRRRTVRELLVDVLKKAKVQGAAALADAALGGLDGADADAPTEFLADEEPWPDSVDGAALLNAVQETLTRYVVLPDVDAARAIVLWIVLTYFDAVVNLLPLLLLTSPTKRCGKSKTVEVVGGLACRALPLSNITVAALFRAIEKFHPTILLDEADTFLKDDPELRGVINGGHTRHTARVVRCVGDDSEPRIFSTWCPKLVAMIGVPNDTLLDRSIVIRLERKAPHETVTRLRADTAHLAFTNLRRQIRRWADDHLDTMRTADPEMPGGLHDRAVDNYRPLVAIADLAGGLWPGQAREAAVRLGADGGEDDPIAEELLADLRVIFEDRTLFDSGPRDRLSTARATELLVALDSKPWATYNTKAGKPISQHQVARLLKRFGVRPKKAKIGAKAENCYLRELLDPVWERYSPPIQVGTSEPVNESGSESSVSGRNHSGNGSDPNTAESSMNPVSVPRFRPEDPPATERRPAAPDEDAWLEL